MPISEKTFALLMRLAPRERFFRWGSEFARSSVLIRDREGSFDRNLWESLALLGLFDPKISLRDQVEAFIGLAAGTMDVPFALSAIAHGAVAVELLERFGTEKQKELFLTDMVLGKTIAAVSNAEEGGGTDVKSIASRLEPDGNGRVLLHLNKRGATNLSFADVIIASVWRLPNADEPPDAKSTMEVVLLDGRRLNQESHVTHLVGFKTGLTGSVRTETPTSLHLSDALLGGERAGFKVLKHCFNIERLLIPAVLVGVLDEMLRLALDFIDRKKSFGKPISDFQYVQEKVIAIYCKRERIYSIMERILSSESELTKEGLAEHTKLLSMLKMTAVEESFSAATLFYELCGYTAYRLDHLAQKILRDVMALKMLGGTKEQQKIILFQELYADYQRQNKTLDGKENKNEKKSA